jgi:hypothetical protein
MTLNVIYGRSFFVATAELFAPTTDNSLACFLVASTNSFVLSFEI